MQVFPLAVAGAYRDEWFALGRQNEVNVRRLRMTRKLVRATLIVFALTMSIAAFAGTAAKTESLSLFSPAQINGKTLPAGEYTVKCETTGSTAQVKFLRNGKEVASADGQVKQLASKPDHAQIVTQDGSGGAPSINEIDFAHSGTGVTFTSATMSAGGQ
jgi:hypothetical protein